MKGKKMPERGSEIESSAGKRVEIPAVPISDSIRDGLRAIRSESGVTARRMVRSWLDYAIVRWQAGLGALPPDDIGSLPAARVIDLRGLVLDVGAGIVVALADGASAATALKAELPPEIAVRPGDYAIAAIGDETNQMFNEKIMIWLFREEYPIPGRYAHVVVCDDGHQVASYVRVVRALGPGDELVLEPPVTLHDNQSLELVGTMKAAWPGTMGGTVAVGVPPFLNPPRQEDGKSVKIELNNVLSGQALTA